jgi:ankyrin repeat protein
MRKKDKEILQLLQVLQEDNLKEVRSLLKGGTNPNIKNEEGNRPLYISIDTGRLEIINFLIEIGAKVNAMNNFGETALFAAAKQGKADIIPFLISKGANVKVPDKALMTPLMVAARNGHNEVVKLLLSGGANSNDSSLDGRTVLMMAAQFGHEEVVRLLIKEGADVNYANSLDLSLSGKTALMTAVQDEHEEVVRILIKEGADVNYIDNQDRSALSLAKEYHIENIVSILQEVANNPYDHLLNIIQETLQTEFLSKISEEVAVKLTRMLIANLGKQAIPKIDPSRVADRALSEIMRHMRLHIDQVSQGFLVQIATALSKEFKPKMTTTDIAAMIAFFLPLIVFIGGIWWKPFGALKFWVKMLLSIIALFSSGIISVVVETIAKRLVKK